MLTHSVSPGEASLAIAAESPDDVPRTVVVAVAEPRLRSQLLTWLANAGFRPQGADHARAVKTAIQRWQPAILVVDCDLVGLAGRSWGWLLRGSPLRQRPYVLTLAGAKDWSAVAGAIDVGVDDFVTKPVRKREFLARVANGVQRLRRLKLVVEQAEADPLTGAMRRRRFHELCRRAIARAASSGHPLSCMVIDIDRFKQINDAWGHALGDWALQSLVRTLRSHLRRDDLLARVGGDEFSTLLPGLGAAEALPVAERIRAALSRRPLPGAERKVRLRVSIGIAEWRPGIIIPEHLIDLADQALLMAKRQGGDRVEPYVPPAAATRTQARIVELMHA
jgi:two-component system, cell cycle response regulator